jgi:hypothetical protein
VHLELKFTDETAPWSLTFEKSEWATVGFAFLPCSGECRGDQRMASKPGRVITGLMLLGLTAWAPFAHTD